MPTAARRICALAFFCGSLFAADSIPPAGSLVNLEEEALPAAARASSPLFGAQLEALRRERLAYGCKVSILSEVTDPDALSFERRNAEAGAADVDDLNPIAAQALDSFRQAVISLGGTFELTSAYRPPAYQDHLHEVWMKWMKQLRSNRSAGCRALREDVASEFARHGLLSRQQPVSLSDHEFGLAFDAHVRLPRGAKFKGKRITVDKLAAVFGFKRPIIRRDPVHFKLIRPTQSGPLEVSLVQSPAL